MLSISPRLHLVLLFVLTVGCSNIVIDGRFIQPADVTATALATSIQVVPTATPDLAATAAMERAVRLTLTAARAPTNTPAPSPGAFLIAFPEFEAVEGWEWPDGIVVHLEIDDPATAASPDFERDGITASAPGEDTRTYVRFDFAGEFDLKVGDIVSVTDGATARTHRVRNLSVMAVNAVADSVAGIADPGAPVDVWPHEFDQTATVRATASGAGDWLARFDGRFDLAAGWGGRSRILDEAGNSTAVDWIASTPSAWRDEFDGSLDEGWYWVNANPDTSSLTEEPGFLRIYSSHAGMGNLLLKSVAQGDFTIETHLLFEPDANFQFAGLVIYQDERNDLAFGRAFCNTPNVCVGNGIYFDYVRGGTWVGGNFGTRVRNPSEAYLRLDRRGEIVKAFFSYDGLTWFEIGTHRIPVDFQANGVGLMAAGDYNTSDADIPADFDYFDLAEGEGAELAMANPPTETPVSRATTKPTPLPTVTSAPVAEPFTGTWVGPDSMDGSITTLVLVQAGNTVRGTFSDTYSPNVQPPGYAGSGSGTVLSDTTAQMTFNLARWDGKTAESKTLLTLSNQNNTLTLTFDSCSGGCPIVLQRQ